MDLEIVINKETGEIAEMVLRGRVDIRTAELVSSKVDALLAEGRRHIIMNMRRVKFIDSQGLSSLIKAQRRVAEANGSLRLVQPNPTVAKLLEITQLSTVFSVHDNKQEAVAAIARGSAPAA